MALFVDRAQVAARRFELNDETLAPVLHPCRQLDGSALAIEVAAARLPLLGLAGLVSALDERLALLTNGQRDRPDRQQALRALPNTLGRMEQSLTLLRQYLQMRQDAGAGTVPALSGLADTELAAGQAEAAVRTGLALLPLPSEPAGPPPPECGV